MHRLTIAWEPLFTSFVSPRNQPPTLSVPRSRCWVRQPSWPLRPSRYAVRSLSAADHDAIAANRMLPTAFLV